MDTLDEYQEQIQPILQKLEKLRLEQLAKTKEFQVYYLLPALLTIIAIPVYWKINPVMAFVIFGIAVAVGIQIATNTVSQPSQDYLNKFKKQIFTTFAKTYFSKISYQIEKKVSPKVFLNSELFEQTPSDYNGKDCFRGKTKEGYKFQFSEITAHKEDKLLFDGLFFELEMPTNFQSKVLVLPNKGKRSPKKVQTLEQLSLKGLTADGDLVAVANVYPKFEKDFVVYSHSKEMAYYILTPPIIEGIYAIYQKWNLKPQISFINNRIYVAIAAKYETYLPNIHTSLVENAALIELLQELSATFEVINHLCVASAAPPEDLPENEDNSSANDDFPSLED
ncbi:DUF3137 domain-containing protein [Aureispira anguillae]|uniref:DUF3137 domain-containing protein n=1 Tax=Aureispira anguillae TaxID=2864201 RepID=A0A916DQX4_9BACT|nr:DUF3137 domain-containing protein [Aureispira anguillae]BDS10330.1 DUF3137 domain-containing protein [Aureispira anguillae]